MFATALRALTVAWRNTAVRRWRKKSGIPVQRNSRRRRITILKVKAYQVPTVNKRLDWYWQDRAVLDEFVVSWGLMSLIVGKCAWDEHEQHMMNQADPWITHSSDRIVHWSYLWFIYSTYIDDEERWDNRSFRWVLLWTVRLYVDGVIMLFHCYHYTVQWKCSDNSN